MRRRDGAQGDAQVEGREPGHGVLVVVVREVQEHIVGSDAQFTEGAGELVDLPLKFAVGNRGEGIVWVELWEFFEVL